MLSPALKKLRIATRKSALALWQANFVADALKSLYPDLNIELVKLVSQGDKLLESPLAKIGGKGLFVKELEHALLNNEADIAVHSMKDVPMHLPDNLCLPVICKREDPRDAFVSNRFCSLDELPEGAVVGTSSLRRQCQLLASRPDISIRFLRGNVNTRLSKLDAGEYDAIILASAGLLRLGFNHRIKMHLSVKQSIPAAGQGAIGIEVHSGREEIQALIAPLHHKQTACCVEAERTVNRVLNGSCQVPIASFSTINEDRLFLRGLVGMPDGSRILKAETKVGINEHFKAGDLVAKQLLDQGANEILATLV